MKIVSFSSFLLKSFTCLDVLDTGLPGALKDVETQFNEIFLYSNSGNGVRIEKTEDVIYTDSEILKTSGEYYLSFLKNAGVSDEYLESNKKTLLEEIPPLLVRRITYSIIQSDDKS